MRIAILLLCLVTSLPLLANEPPTPLGQLCIETDPAGAQVYIDRQLVGVTPYANDMPFGRYLVELRLSNYETVRQVVNIDANLPRYPLATTLRKLTGFWVVRSQPTGAEVSVDGISVGKTPLTLTSLSLGRHQANIVLPGYKSKTVLFELPNRVPVVQEIELTSDSGGLSIESDPPGATVFVNNAEQGTTPLELDRLSAGQTQSVTLRMAGYEEVTRTFNFTPGQKESLQIKLIPLPGTLSVYTLPAGARVYVDDEYQGDKDGVKLKLPAGSHRVRVELPGYKPMARTVEVPKGGSVAEEFRLLSNRGTITVVTTPPGTSVYIDGKLRGVTKASPNGDHQPSLPFVIEQIDAGEHTIKLVAKNCKDASKKLMVEAGKDCPVTAALIRMFTPNYEVRTAGGRVVGILKAENLDGIRLETAPGVIRTIPKSQIRAHGPLKD